LPRALAVVLPLRNTMEVRKTSKEGAPEAGGRSPLPAQSAGSPQDALARERDRLRLLLDVNNAIVSTLDMPDVFAAISAFCRDVVHHEYTSLALLEKETNSLRLFALDFPDGRGFIKEDMVMPLSDTPASRAIESRQPTRFDLEILRKSNAEICKLMMAENLRCGVCFPLATRNGVLGTLNVASLRADAFTDEDVELLSQVAGQVAIGIENVLAYCENEELRNKLAEEKLYLEDEIRTAFHFEEIIGESASLKNVLKQAETVAPTNSTVLLLGETGTGKEVIARAIHSNSKRSEATFVKMNCSAIPGGLLESELFGHEKGAFTGAIAQRLGRFELAHRGTIFLDEIGDVPLELQPKLLRVLQEQEFDRVGGTKTIRVDVRVLAATNRDLSAMVAAHQFRSDLYYRLNVFPILLPPLRERTEDIPALVRFFARNYSRRMNKKIESIPAEAMDALVRYPWPGNIRELENLVERAVILSPGTVLKLPLPELAAAADPRAGKKISTLADAERQHILRALEECQWVIGGPNGAANRLGMKRTTLQSRMAKLLIVKPG
jgi:formate hydrogenlyase transcriptional activator